MNATRPGPPNPSEAQPCHKYRNRHGHLKGRVPPESVALCSRIKNDKQANAPREDGDIIGSGHDAFLLLGERPQTTADDRAATVKPRLGEPKAVTVQVSPAGIPHARNTTETGGFKKTWITSPPLQDQNMHGEMYETKEECKHEARQRHTKHGDSIPCPTSCERDHLHKSATSNERRDPPAGGSRRGVDLISPTTHSLDNVAANARADIGMFPQLSSCVR